MDGLARDALPPVVDRDTFEDELDVLRRREKLHTREGDALAAVRRRLPAVEVDGTTELLGPAGPTTLLDAFEGRRQLIAYYFMWYPGRPAAEQCEGCTYYTDQIGGLAPLHSRDTTYAVLCQGRNVSVPGADPQASYAESLRYRAFMGWDMPWYSAQSSLETLLVGRELGLFHLVCYLRDGDRVLETYWTTRRGVEAMDHTYALMDLTALGRQEPWEDSPPGRPQRCGVRTDSGAPDWRPVTPPSHGRPLAQWPRLAAGFSDDLGSTAAPRDAGAPLRCH